ncbi:hypothetical protein VZT92_005546 [Zoarces viviparus]|uniref:HAT C-terminal dimerisation domain-containing protein n=1 Tax=Zoarces viviparus TaxID=48416 RepID=A0AAW1FTG8_ZOAVI
MASRGAEELERPPASYKSQQAAIYSALTYKTLKKNIRNIVTVSDADVKIAEEVLQGQATEHTLTGPDSEASPPQKKSAIEELFGETFASKDADHHTFGGDPLAWWKSNQCKYPHIAMMARRYLAVPGTSVPSERVFSTAGDIVTAKRSTLSPENVDILIFVKKNLKL